MQLSSQNHDCFIFLPLKVFHMAPSCPSSDEYGVHLPQSSISSVLNSIISAVAAQLVSYYKQWWKHLSGHSASCFDSIALSSGFLPLVASVFRV